MANNLTNKQIAFCKEYVLDWNATRAALAAGYSEKSAQEIGSQNLSKVIIQDYIKLITSDLEKLAGVSELKQIKRLVKISENEDFENNGFAIKAIEVTNKMLGYDGSNRARKDEIKEVQIINRTTLATEATPQYLNVTLAVKDNKIIILRGGTRSSKSYTLAQMACDWLVTGSIGAISTDDTFSIIMESIPALKNTVVKDIEEILDLRKIVYKHHRTDKYFELGKRRITYFSSDSLSKMKVKSGFIWVDEADTMDYSFFQQLIARSSVGRVFLAFNPSNPDIWINQKLEIERAQIQKDVKVFISSYLTNPFLSDSQVEEIEYLMTIDPEFKQVYGLGLYGNITGLMYPIWELFSVLPKNELEYFEVLGQDYGFTDPHAILRLLFDKVNRSVYVYETFYETQAEFEQIKDALMPFQETARAIITDNSQPATTSSFQNIFTQMEATAKWQGSILDGIRIVKKYKVYIHESAKNVIRENKSYMHAKNKQTGLRLEQPEDKNNHALDALRYGVMWYENVYGYEYDI